MIENVEKRKYTIKIINTKDNLTYYQFFYIPFFTFILSFIFDLYFIYILIGFTLYILLFILKTDLFEVRESFYKIIKSITVFAICILIGFGIFNYTSKTLGFGINDSKNTNTKIQILNEKIASISKNSLDLNININDFKRVKDDEYIKSEEFLKLLKSGDCGEQYKNIINTLYSKKDTEFINTILGLYDEGYYFKYFITQSNQSGRPTFYIKILNLKNEIIDKEVNISTCDFCQISKISSGIFNFKFLENFDVDKYIKNDSYYVTTLYLNDKGTLNTVNVVHNNSSNSFDENFKEISKNEQLKYITKEYALPINKDFCSNFE